MRSGGEAALRSPAPRPAPAASVWERAIEAFERRDAAHAPAPGAVLFVGSSSIRMWKTLELDMAPYRVLNRGFGGSHLDHVVHYAPRIVLPYRPRAIVVYAGDNDLAARSPKDAARVVADFDRFVELVREAGQDPPILFVAIKPSRARWAQWPRMQDANSRIARRCERDARLHYVDIAAPMLAQAPPGEPPPPRLFLDDGLHLSAEGYALWTRAVRGILSHALDSESAAGSAAPPARRDTFPEQPAQRLNWRSR